MKRVGAWFALLAMVVAVAVPAAASTPTSTSTPQQRQHDIDTEVQRLRRQVGEASAQQAELYAELEVSRRTRTGLDAKVAGLDAAIATAETDLESVNGDLDAAVLAEQASNQAVTDARRQLDDSESALREAAVQAYIRLGATPSVDDMVLSAKDTEEVPRLVAYAQAVTDRQLAIVSAHRQLQEDTALVEAKAADAKAAVSARHQEVVSRKAALETARAEQATARSAAAGETSTEQQLLVEVNAKKGDYLRQINELERESSSVAAALRRRQAGEAVTPSGHGVFAAPVADPVVTSPFGYRIHPIYGDLRLHTGVDFAASTGTPVHAAGDGVVMFAGWMSGYGNTVIIDHGGALATLYAHNSALQVAVGDKVARRQLIASAGSTGNSTGPHVHFEVRVDGTPVDPMSYL